MPTLLGIDSGHCHGGDEQAALDLDAARTASVVGRPRLGAAR